MTDTGKIYDVLNARAPFSLAESWDNSGVLVNAKRNVSRVLTALDITKKVAEEAVSKGAELVLSHHPVIFHPLSSLDGDNPAVILAKNDIGAICLHTNLDIAENGLNDFLCKALGFTPLGGTPLDFDGGNPIGKVCDLPYEYSCEKLGEIVKLRLGCKVLRFNRISKPIKRIGVCSGSGGSFLSGALRNGCDALVTGDVRHDVFIAAENSGIAVFDAGHFYTETIFNKWVKELLSDSFPELTVLEAESGSDPCSYL